MKRRNNKISIFSLLIVAILCITIGYAAINSIVLNITGKVDASAPKEIYITDVEYVSDIDAEKTNCVIENYTKTTMQSKITLSNTNSASEIIYKVKVYNNSSEEGTFLDVLYDKEFYDNENISFEILDTGFKVDDKIAVKEKKDIYIKFKYKDGVIPESNVLNSYINFKIGKPNMLAVASSSGDFFNSVSRSNIEKISFELAKIPENATQTFDASAKQDKSIMGYVTDTDGNGFKEITFSSSEPIYANTDSSYLFYYLTNLKSIEFNNFKTSEVTNMKAMFCACKLLENLDASNFNTSNVTSMSNLFNSCKSLTSLDVSNFDTSNVTDMSYMFSSCSSLTSLNVSKFDTSNVTNMHSMFSSCSRLTSIDVSKINTEKVTNMRAMFDGCNNLTNIDVSNFDTSNVTDIGYMFAQCTSLTSLDVSNFNTLNVIHMDCMFYKCSNLTTIYASDKFVTTKVNDSNNMFTSCTSLVGGNGTAYDSNYTDGTYARIDTSATPGYFTRICTLKSTKSESSETSTFLGLGTRNTITKVVIENAQINAPDTAIDISEEGDGRILGWLDGTEAHIASNGTLCANENSSYLFANLTNCTEIENLNLLNTSKTTNMYCMFSKCSTLTSLDTSKFDTSNVTNFSYMFNYCKKLTSLDVSGFDTAKATNTSYMFYYCESLTSLDVSGFDTSNVTTMAYMFGSCKEVTELNVSNFNTSKTTNMNHLFAWCYKVTSLDVSSFNTANVTNMQGMFIDCRVLTSLNLSGFDTSNVTSMTHMFTRCYKLTSLDLSSFRTSKISDMTYMFSECESLTSLDVSSFDTSNVKSLYTTFKGCKLLTTLDLSSFDTSNVTNMYYTFNGCTNLKTIYASKKFVTTSLDRSYSTGIFTSCTSLVGGNGTTYNSSNNEILYARIDTIDTPGYFTEKIAHLKTTSSETSASSTFLGMGTRSSITKVIFEDTKANAPSSAIDVSAASDKSVVGWLDGTEAHIASNCAIYANANSSYLFANLKNCTAIENLELLKTNETTNMSYIFYNCNVLTSLNVSNFNTSNVTNMSSMFYNCKALTSLDVSNFNTSNVTNMSNLFRYCQKITNLNLSNFNTAKVTNMGSMFSYCSELINLNVSSFDTSNATNIYNMFAYCGGLTSLDLSSFNTAKVTDMMAMFYRCSKLKTIYVTDKFVTDKVSSSSYMFISCTSLVGGNGTTFNSSYTDSLYARIDTASTPGYFTEVSSLKTTSNESSSSSTFLGMGTRSSITKVIFESTTTNAPSDAVDVSEAGNGSIVGWLDGTEAHVASDITIFANADSSYLFANLTKCTAIENLNLLNTSKVTNMKSMFYRCMVLTSLDFSNFNTSKVTNMYNMFAYCRSLISLDLSGFDTFNVTDMANMFGNCQTLTNLDVSGFNTTNVTRTANMFANCYVLESLDVSKFDTSNVNDMYAMFGNCQTLTNLDVSNFDTSKVTRMLSMFTGCENLKNIDVSKFNTSKVTNMQSMFANCYVLESIDVSNFDTSNVTTMDSMFYNCSALTSLNLSSFNTSKVTDMDYMFNSCSKLKTIVATSKFVTTSVTSSTDMFTSCSSVVGGNGTKYNSNYIDKTYARIDTSSTPGYFTKPKTLKTTSSETSHTSTFLGMGKRSEIVKVVLKSSTSSAPSSATDVSEAGDGSILGWINGNVAYIASNGTIYANENSSNLFQGLIYCTAIENLNLLNTSNVTNMESMFEHLNVISSLDLSNFDTSNVTNMGSMFASCNQLESLDLSNFDTSNVTNMSGMFKDCDDRLTTLNLRNFDTSNVTVMSGMFSQCESLTTLDLSNFDTSKVTDMSYMFDWCRALTSLNVNSFNTSNVIDMTCMFYLCDSLTSLDVSSFDTSNVTNMSDMFRQCSSLKTIYASDSFVTTQVPNLKSNKMFKDSTALVGGNGTKFSSSYVDKTYARIDKSGQKGYFTSKD